MLRTSKRFQHSIPAIRGEDDHDAGALDKVQSALDSIRRVDIDASYASICSSLEDIDERLSDISGNPPHQGWH